MIVTRTEITALAFCAQQLDEDGELAFDAGGVPAGTERCPGYRQQPVPAIRETVEFSYLDGGANPSDPMDVHRTERATERLLWADEADEPCPHCHYPRVLSEQVRPVYASLGGSRGGPDALFADRRARRQQTEAAQTAASAAERSAAALEAIAAGSGAAEIAELRGFVEAQSQQIAELQAQLERNGHEPAPAPTPRKRAPA